MTRLYLKKGREELPCFPKLLPVPVLNGGQGLSYPTVHARKRQKANDGTSLPLPPHPQLPSCNTPRAPHNARRFLGTAVRCRRPFTHGGYRTVSEFLEFVDVSKNYGAIKASDHVSLSVKQGEFFSLLGPSGCGKTTLLRMLAGFESPDSGRILLDGQDITDIPPYRRKVNTIFQNYALFPHLSLWDNIAFGLRVAKKKC